MTGRAAQKAESVKLVALDVDGVMTDGTLFYRAMSEPETKPFNIKDGLGIKLLQRYDIDVAIITGKSSEALQRRAEDLGIATVIQGREDKGSALKELLNARGLSAAEVAYMGDDLPDLGALRLAGLATCPNDAVEAVRQCSDWIAPLPGGAGAVRALADFILHSQDHLSDVIRTF